MPGRRGDPGLQSRLPFGPHDMRLKSRGEARLRDLARAPSRSLSVRELKAEQDHEIVAMLRARAGELAPIFGLRYAAIEAERDGLNDYYGVCYDDGIIRIRLWRAALSF